MKNDKDSYIKFLENKIDTLENIVESTSFRDIATELFKRDLFEFNKESIANILIKDKNKNIPWSILYCDINNLKFANDIYGHEETDQGIKVIADILREQTRSKQRNKYLPNDIIISHIGAKESLSFRMGGDEFIVLLPHCNKINALKIANRIKNKIKEEPIGKTKGLSLSIGIADTLDIKKEIKEPNKEDAINFISDLIALADKLMYQDKIKYFEKLSDEEKNEVLMTSLSRIAKYFNLNVYEKKDFEKFKELLNKIKI